MWSHIYSYLINEFVHYIDNQTFVDVDISFVHTTEYERIWKYAYSRLLVLGILVGLSLGGAPVITAAIVWEIILGSDVFIGMWDSVSAAYNFVLETVNTIV